MQIAISTGFKMSLNTIETVIIDPEETSRELLKSYLEEVPQVRVTEEFNEFVEGYNHILEHRPNVVIIDISNKTDLAIEIINKIATMHKSAKIIVTSYEINTDVIIKSMRAGAREFIAKPVIKKEFIDAITKMRELVLGNISEDNKCKIISAFSNKGGIGKTAIATNLALEIANITKEKVALIDLNLQLGDVTTFLDINPSFDISYIINNLNRIDDTFLLSTLEKYKSTNLYILADPPYLEQAEEISPEQINELINVLKTTFSYIIIDTGSNFDGKTIAALDNSDLILLITIVNLPAIRNCQRCLELFERLGYPEEKVKIVLNRYMENDEIKTQDVEEVLNKKVYWKIPNNYYTIMSAINKGIPVASINQDSNIAQSYRELAALLSDNIVHQMPTKQVKRSKGLGLLNFFKKN